jgi:hypothetical protein
VHWRRPSTWSLQVKQSVVKTAGASWSAAGGEAGGEVVCTSMLSLRAHLQASETETEIETETQMDEVEVGLTASEGVTLVKATAAHSPYYLAMLIGA